MLEKDIRGGVYHVIQQYAKANNKYIKIIMKISNHCILSSGMQIISKDEQYHKGSLPVDGFKCVENTSRFVKHFIGNYNEDRDEGYFFEVDIKYPEDLHEVHNDLPFLLEKSKNI